MGYRSAVAIELPSDAYKELLKEDKKLGHEIISEVPDHVFETNDDTTILIYKYVKWYMSDEAIEWLHSKLDELEEKGSMYAFLRLGEDDDYVEYKGNFDNNNISWERNFKLFSLKDSTQAKVIEL